MKVTMTTEFSSNRPPWKKVVFSSDCDEDGNCPLCQIDYADCGCPGPTQEDEYDYWEDADGTLWATPLPAAND